MSSSDTTDLGEQTISREAFRDCGLPAQPANEIGAILPRLGYSFIRATHLLPGCSLEINPVESRSLWRELQHPFTAQSINDNEDLIPCKIRTFQDNVIKRTPR